MLWQILEQVYGWISNWILGWKEVVAVVLGFLLAVCWDAIKERRTRKELNLNLRYILYGEVWYNRGVLMQIVRKVKDEEAKYKATYKADGMGGYTAEGDPWRAMRQFSTSQLSTDVWISLLDQIPSVLSGMELEKLFMFYRNLAAIQSLHAEYVAEYALGSHGSEAQLKRVLDLIEETTKNTAGQ